MSLVIGVVAGVALAAARSIAWATIPGSDGVIHANVELFNKSIENEAFAGCDTKLMAIEALVDFA